MLEPKLGKEKLPHLAEVVIPYVRCSNFLTQFTSFLFVSAEILVLGTGAKLERINPSVLALLKKKGIAVEIQDTVIKTYVPM